MELNTQVIEKKVDGNGGILDIVGIFKTIQGEGPFTGQPAIFVRLAGCNLQCPGCDTDYTTNRGKREVLDIVKEIEDIAEADESLKFPIVVVTGGEPFRQNITVLCNNLALKNYIVQVETNGSYAPIGELNPDVVIVCSPKAGSVNKEIAERAACFKYVMSADSVDEEDGLPLMALGNVIKRKLARPPEGYDKPIYLQPMDAQDEATNEANLEAVKASCMKHNYTLQLQVHKILGVE